MRQWNTVILIVLTLLLVVGVARVTAMAAAPPLCPYLNRTLSPPYAALHYVIPGVSDAIVSGGYLLVAQTDGSFSLYPLQNVSYSVVLGRVVTPPLLTFTNPGLVNAELEYVAPGIIGVKAEPESAGSGINYVAAILGVCKRPKPCLVLTRYLASKTEVIGIYGVPGGRYHGDYAVFYANGVIYVFGSKPNLIDHELELGQGITRVYRLKTCGIYSGFLVALSNSTLILLNRDLEVRARLNLNYTSIYNVYLDLYTSTLYIVGSKDGGVEVASVLLLRKPVINTIHVSSTAPQNAIIVRTSKGLMLLLYYRVGGAGLIEGYVLSPGSVKLRWSIPLDGALTAAYPIYKACTADRILLVYYSANGVLRLQVLDPNNGVLMSVPLWGLPLANATVLHFTEGWLVAGNETDVYLVYVPLMLHTLYAVPIGLQADGIRVKYNATIQCLYGACISLPVIRIVDARGLYWVALPPGTYRVTYVSSYGIVERYFHIPSTCELMSSVVNDPPLLQFPSTATIKLLNVTICVESVGDPQGWGFGRGPVANAILRIVRTDVGLLVAQNTTGSNGCTTLVLSPGEYRVSVSARGFKTTSTVIIVSENRTRFTIRLEPLTLLVVFNVLAADTNQKLDAKLLISCCGRSIETSASRKILLPIGVYTVQVRARLYEPKRVILNVTIDEILRHEKKPLILTVRLAPARFNVAIRVILQSTFKANATLSVTFQRLKPVMSPPVTYKYIIPAKHREVVVKASLIWGTYSVEVIAPFHQPVKINITVPTATMPTVKLQVVRYRLTVRAIDAATSKPVTNGVVEISGPGGFKLKVPLGSSTLIPIGNYTYVVEAPHYKRKSGKLNVNHDTVLIVKLQPLRVRLQVLVYLGDKPLPNITVNIVGTSFNGLRVSKTLITSKDGRAVATVPPGTYTISAGYKISSLFLTLTLNATKKVTVDDKPMQVKLQIPSTLLLLVIGILPYLVLLVVVIVVALLLFLLRKRFAESMRKLREALVEKLGAGGFGEEEGEEEEIF